MAILLEKDIVQALLPDELKNNYDLPHLLTNKANLPYHYKLLNFEDRGNIKLEVWSLFSKEDPCFVVELHTNHLGQVEIVWISANNLDSPKYNVDSKGRLPLKPASGLRNIAEELRAFAAGLVPNQVRQGLGILSSSLKSIEEFAAMQGARMLTIFPLAYHNAIEYERHGFTYRSGKDLMVSIHNAFGSGNHLAKKLNGNSPFRKPWMANSIRGRSWAIHDGILGSDWYAPEMYKILGRENNLETAPGVNW